jgi:hypothetical protein
LTVQNQTAGEVLSAKQDPTGTAPLRRSVCAPASDLLSRRPDLLEESSHVISILVSRSVLAGRQLAPDGEAQIVAVKV